MIDAGSVPEFFQVVGNAIKAGAADLHCDAAGAEGAALQFVRRAIGNDLALVNDDGAGAAGLDLFKDVSGKDNGLGLPHFLDEIPHHVFLIGIQTIGGFIKDKDLGIMDDGLRKAGAVTVAFG